MARRVTGIFQLYSHQEFRDHRSLLVFVSSLSLEYFLPAFIFTFILFLVPRAQNCESLLSSCGGLEIVNLAIVSLVRIQRQEQRNPTHQLLEGASMEPWKHEGYQSLSTWMASDDDCFVFRRFESLNARIILWMQNRICAVEAELQAVHDTAEDHDEDNGGWYHEAIKSSKDRERESLIQQLRDMLFVYDKMLVHHQNAAHLPCNTLKIRSDSHDDQRLMSRLKYRPRHHRQPLQDPAVLQMLKSLGGNQIDHDTLEDAWQSHHDSACISTGAHRTGRTISPILTTLLVGSLISPVHAQSTMRTANDLKTDWKQRALNTLTDHLVLSASLPVPVIVCAGSVITARRFYKNRREDKASLLMLATAIMFVSSSRSSNTDTADVNRYVPQALGLAYYIFMFVLCRLVASRNGWRKGSCAIAIALGICMAVIGLSFAPIQSYWVDLTKTSPLFALSVSIPCAFSVCDVVAYIFQRVNSSGSEPTALLPPPVPGRQ